MILNRFLIKIYRFSGDHVEENTYSNMIDLFDYFEISIYTILCKYYARNETFRD